MEEIFYYLEHADKPCIVTIDEFQQIAKYPEKKVEALLRTHVQSFSNQFFDIWINRNYGNGGLSMR